MHHRAHNERRRYADSISARVNTSISSLEFLGSLRPDDTMMRARALLTRLERNSAAAVARYDILVDSYTVIRRVRCRRKSMRILVFEFAVERLIMMESAA